MNHYTYHKTLEALWDHAYACYQGGNQDAATYFDSAQQADMQALGLRAHEVFDFVDDCIRYDGQPDKLTFILVQSVRRAYLNEVLKGKAATRQLTADDFPSKTDAIDGIPWLPRIIKKAEAKLRGEIHEDFMYGCAGDRQFLTKYDIHPADLLNIVWMANGNTEAVVKWVKDR